MLTKNLLVRKKAQRHQVVVMVTPMSIESTFSSLVYWYVWNSLPDRVKYQAFKVWRCVANRPNEVTCHPC